MTVLLTAACCMIVLPAHPYGAAACSPVLCCCLLTCTVLLQMQVLPEGRILSAGPKLFLQFATDNANANFQAKSTSPRNHLRGFHLKYEGVLCAGLKTVTSPYGNITGITSSYGNITGVTSPYGNITGVSVSLQSNLFALCRRPHIILAPFISLYTVAQWLAYS